MPQYSSEKNLQSSLSNIQNLDGKEKVIFTLPQPILNIYNVYVLVNLCKLKAGTTFVCTDTTDQVLFQIHILGNV